MDLRRNVSQEAFQSQLYEEMVNEAISRNAYIADLEHKSSHDFLTGLPNRIELQDKFSDAIQNQETYGQGALLFLDFDNFGNINKGKGGYATGDYFLQGISGALKDIITLTRKNDTIARVGGDEFIVLMPGISEETAAKRAEVLCKLFENIVAINNIPVSTGLSIGVAPFNKSSDYEKVLEKGDKALRAAKEKGKGTVIQYSDVDK